MGLLSMVFGGGSSKYSQEEQELSREKIKEIVSTTKINSLSEKEESLVEVEIEKRRRGDGKISMRQIFESLTSLVNANLISKYDRDGIMKAFKNYFAK